MAPRSDSIPRKQPRQQRSVATVSAILDTCAHILVAEGYAGLNTNRVAEQAGVSIGSLYQYFPNKTALITAVRQRHADQMKAQIQALMPQAAALPLREAVHALISVVMAAHTIDPQLHRVLEQEVPRQSQGADRSDWEAELHQTLKTTLGLYAADIQIRNLDLTCLVLHRVVDTLVHATLLDAHATPEDMAHEITIVVLNYLQGPHT